MLRDALEGKDRGKIFVAAEDFSLERFATFSPESALIGGSVFLARAARYLGTLNAAKKMASFELHAFEKSK